MSRLEYIKYLDETNGVMPESWMTAKDSFNNVVYHTHLLISREVNGKLSKADLDIFRSHLEQTKDKDGLYKPKNSKDNLVAKTAACYNYKLVHELNDMKLMPMVLSSYLNPWDAFFYMHCKSPKWLQILLFPLILLTYLQMWVAIAKKHKVRPKFHERVLWTLQGKKYELRYYMNDGKQLSILKSYALRKDYPLLTKFIRSRFLKRFNNNKSYPYIMFTAFFKDKSHPVIFEYKLAAEFDREVL